MINRVNASSSDSTRDNTCWIPLLSYGGGRGHQKRLAKPQYCSNQRKDRDGGRSASDRETKQMSYSPLRPSKCCCNGTSILGFVVHELAQSHMGLEKVWSMAWLAATSSRFRLSSGRARLLRLCSLGQQVSSVKQLQRTIASV